MRYAGRAFRAPPRNDVEGWEVAARLIAAGQVFASTRRRRAMPRTLKELETWQREEAAFGAEGRVRIDVVDGHLQVRLGATTLADGAVVQVWLQGWQTARLRLTGDGGLPLPRPVVVVGARVVVVEGHTRLRMRVAR